MVDSFFLLRQKDLIEDKIEFCFRHHVDLFTSYENHGYIDGIDQLQRYTVHEDCLSIDDLFYLQKRY